MNNLPQSQRATVVLFPARFQIAGPYELIALTQAIVRNKSNSDEELKYQVEELWSNWYVPCSITDQQITLDQLKYWDVDLQECYKGPEVVPNRYATLPHDSKSD